MTMYIIIVACRHCSIEFNVCRGCWFGKAYCSDTCRIKNQTERHRESQRQYRQTDKGKKCHADSERSRRQRQHQQKHAQKNTVDDDSTTSPVDSSNLGEIGNEAANISFCTKQEGEFSAQRYAFCVVCGCLGVIVPEFPPRAYGKLPKTQLIGLI